MLSYDEKIIISVGEDGSISTFILSLVLFRVKSATKPVKENHLPLSEDILLEKDDMKRMIFERNRLSVEVKKLREQNENKIQIKQSEFEEQLKQLEEDFAYTEDIEVQRYADLQDTIDKMEGDWIKKIVSNNEDFDQEEYEMEVSQTQKLNGEVNRYYALSEENENYYVKLERDTDNLLEYQQQYKDNLNKKYEQEFNEIVGRCDNLVKRKEQMLNEYNELEKELEEEFEEERIETINKFSKMSDLETNQTNTLKSSNKKIHEEEMKLDSNIKSQKIEKAEYSAKELDRMSVIKNLEKDINSHKKEIKEREDTIAGKMIIYAYRQGEENI